MSISHFAQQKEPAAKEYTLSHSFYDVQQVK